MYSISTGSVDIAREGAMH